MQFNLVPHPACLLPTPSYKLWASVDHAAAFGATATVNIWFGIGAPADRFVIPSGEPRRADGLWQTTCFEAFLQPRGQETYREWNFAPSGEWASYDFAAYREDMKPAEVATPYIRMEENLTWWTLGATIAVPSDLQWRLGLSAVMEERDGSKTYWALAHPSETPDFHHPDCFTAKLP
jgi:hypothetical protein